MDDEFPDELRAQLKPPKLNKRQTLMKVLQVDPRSRLGLDDLLRNYYLETGEVLKRQALVQQLYLMRKDQLVESPQHGAYQLTSAGKKLIESILERLNG